MAAILALDGSANEEGVALVAGSAYPLRWVLARQFFTSHTGRHGQNLGLSLCGIITRNRSSYEAFTLELGLPGWEFGAFLAAVMVTVGAHLLRAESDLAAMTGTMNAHADLLLNPFTIAFGWRRPFTGFQGDAIL